MKKSKDYVAKGLMANLKRERVNMFKQFVNAEKMKNIDLNKTCMTSRMPRIVMTNKDPNM